MVLLVRFRIVECVDPDGLARVKSIWNGIIDVGHSLGSTLYLHWHLAKGTVVSSVLDVACPGSVLCD